MRKTLILFMALFMAVAAASLIGGRGCVYAVDDYPQKYKDADKDELIDEWRFYNRECTSFVAWCLNSRNKVAFTNFYKDQWWGNANHWGEAAKAAGFKVDDVPARGAVAWSTAGYYGHVAWVAKVEGDQVYIEEYNLKNTGTYYERVKDKSEFRYIHIRDVDCSIAHNWNSGQVIQKATTDSAGIMKYTCTECGVTRKSMIYSPAAYSLSKDVLTYTGKKLKPEVTVTDQSGQIVAKKYYTLTYSRNRAVGTAKVKVKFKGAYTGSRTLKFKIVPKRTWITAVTGEQNGFTLRWKSRAANCRGYQIRYGTDRTFREYKTKKIKGMTRQTYRVSGLPAGAPCYVQIRVYTVVRGRTYYSAWSNMKKVKTGD